MNPFCINDAVINHILENFDPTSAEMIASIDKRIYELAIWLPGWKENRIYLIHQPKIQVPRSLWCYDVSGAHLFWVTE